MPGRRPQYVVGMTADEPGAQGARGTQILSAGVIGGVAGAALAGHRGARAAGVGAVAGAAALAASEALARARQRPGEIPPLWQRIATSAALVAPLGWAAGRLTSARPVTVGAATGTLGGLLGVRPQKVLLGPVFGAAVGGALARGAGPAPPAVVASATMLAYRVTSALVFRDAQVTLLADRVRAEDLPFVVPREARSRYVGTGYVRELAGRLGGRYAADAPDVGIVASVGELASADFDPSGVDPLVREFYEHTTRFALDIVPQWRLWVRPGLPALPDAGRAPAGAGERADEPAGDPAGHPQPDRHDHAARARRRRRCAAGSARSPIPTSPSTSASTPPTGTAAGGTSASASRCRRPASPRRWCPGPARRRPVLASRSDLDQPGHYLAYIDPASRDLTVLAVRGFAEQLDVFLAGGELRADHAFSVFGFPFLVLHYRMYRKPARPPG